jgi:hypothetical protein
MFHAGLDQAITPNVRVSASYTSRQGLRVLRGRNLNPIENGARLDPRFSNVIEVTGDASARTQMVTVTGSFISLNWQPDDRVGQLLVCVGAIELDRPVRRPGLRRRSRGRVGGHVAASSRRRVVQHANRCAISVSVSCCARSRARRTR